MRGVQNFYEKLEILGNSVEIKDTCRKRESVTYFTHKIIEFKEYVSRLWTMQRSTLTSEE